MYRYIDMYMYYILYIGTGICSYLRTTHTHPKSFLDTFKLLSPLLL